ncbi:Sec-independent protein translocase protein TatB [Luteimonas deserti]|uniref:Sec-independent protein translocase protein TatB n=1 Tax=Luteimonas deserti TaxID=2752306 RepID=A0A7Z0TVB1_9GAMM|nr:Sec-independent protein translocase protein TatB [Luteimonas deserti]NYZ62074.1 twin-arginine translocase subunit TatB [Luteimonas deserti]
MFGISTGELLILALIALVVLGPERLPKAARFAGVWVRRARTQWYSVKSELERELAAEDLKRSMREAQRSIADVGTQLRDAGARVVDGVDEARRGADTLIDEARRMPGDPAEASPPAALPEGAIAADPTTPPVHGPAATADIPHATVRDGSDGPAR